MAINLPLPSSSPVAESRVPVNLIALPPARTSGVTFQPDQTGPSSPRKRTICGHMQGLHRGGCSLASDRRLSSGEEQEKGSGGQGGARWRPEVVFVALGDLLVHLRLPHNLDPVLDVKLVAPDLGFLPARNPMHKITRR